ncbi:MAG TPA: hypothetical protein DIT97_25275 [Gimesia maris]|jgi:hypothetical protein|uniref:Uncharacterized protein n=1 Tax=Gimesia maris TaxID=122 RepID=A0A3D3RBI5_9PLAN|nr:hypothetical protein [Gimesia maris]|tara:strand:- start:14172 stop:14477 length:306 start_codon:yes stop_codon:yes gene_type:complete
MDYPVPYQVVPTPGISSPLVGVADGLLFVCPSEAQIQPIEPDPWFGLDEWEDISDEWELLEESEDFEPKVVVPGLKDRIFIGPIPKSLEVYWYGIIRHDID